MASTPASIPKQIHFVWVGGPIKKEYLENIMKVSAFAKKQGLEINLWVDNENNYYKTAQKEGINVTNLKIRNISELRKNMEKDKFYKNNPQRLKDFDNIIVREMVGLKNLAAASDLLRYEILRQMGGYYFDTDTKFNFDNVTKFEPAKPIHGFLAAGHVTQNEFWGGNDIIAAVPGHPIFEKAILGASRKYKLLDTSKSIPELLLRISQETKTDGKHVQEFVKKYEHQFQTLMDKKRSHQDSYSTKLGFLKADRMNLTIRASGPGVFYDAVTEYFTENLDKPNMDPDTSRKTLLFESDSNESDSNEFNLGGGFIAKSQSHQTWAKKPKLRSFEDTSISYKELENNPPSKKRPR